MTLINDSDINSRADSQELVNRTKRLTSRGYLGFHRLYVDGKFAGWAEMADCYNEIWAVYDHRKNLLGHTHTALNNWSGIARLVGA